MSIKNRFPSKQAHGATPRRDSQASSPEPREVAHRSTLLGSLAFLSVLGATLVAACGDGGSTSASSGIDGKSCEAGESECSKGVVYRCEDEKFTVWDDCEGQGLKCVISQGEAGCFDDEGGVSTSANTNNSSGNGSGGSNSGSGGSSSGSGGSGSGSGGNGGSGSGSGGSGSGSGGSGSGSGGSGSGSGGSGSGSGGSGSGSGGSGSGSGGSGSSTTSCGSGVSVDQDLSGIQFFPPDSAWNTPIDQEPVDPNSDAILTGSSCSGPGNCAKVVVETAMTYNVACGVPADTNFTFTYAADSDNVAYPLTSLIAPQDPRTSDEFFIENGPCGSDCSGADHHLLVVDRGTNLLYEVYNPYETSPGNWSAASGAVFDLGTSTLRPDGKGSSDAAGLPVLPGLIRCDEVTAGEIKHALRFTLNQTKPSYVHPATHFTQTAGAAPMGARFRLKASVNIDNADPPMKVILTALKKYGMFVADNGTNFGISAEVHKDCWVDFGFTEYEWGTGFFLDPGNGQLLEGADFEVVQLGQELTTEFN